ncbi:MAG: metabolite traffic protein EboE [bacterium]
MHISGFHGAHLTYCLNIHPGETWEENVVAIRQYAAKVRDLVAPGGAFGLGLRLSRRAVGTLGDPVHLQAFKRMLADNRMYAFTINGFPFGAFHGTTVKTDVYRPDWRQPERLDYTCRLAEVLAAVLPEGMDGSISTLPVSYREWMKEECDYQAAVEHLAACAARLHELRDRTGCEVHLGLEPEPDCALETTEDVVDFFERRLLPGGAKWLGDHCGLPARETEGVLRRHIGVCFDTCHMSVQFASLEQGITALVGRGIRISKVQISAALRTMVGPDSAGRLEAFVDPVYLHQVKMMDAEGHKQSHPDMTRELLAAWRCAPAAGECRIHFHVPLYVSEYDGIESTAADISPSFLLSAAKAGVRHFEIETYTFNVLPPALRRQAVEQSIAGEYAWVIERFQKSAGKGRRGQ